MEIGEHPMRLISCAALLLTACGWSAERPKDALPARVTMRLTPGPDSFVVGGVGHLDAHAFDSAGRELTWTAPRRIESSDTSVLAVDANGVLTPRRVGFTRLRLEWV